MTSMGFYDNRLIGEDCAKKENLNDVVKPRR
jgi:hypothetical protein